MAVTDRGYLQKSYSRAENGVRTYTVRHLLETDDITIGPKEVAGALPAVGTTYNLGGADVDSWAFLTPEIRITQKLEEGHPTKWWIAELKYKSPEPPSDNEKEEERKRCWDIDIENPLAEPDVISGSFMAGNVRATKTRAGEPIINSAFETVPVDFQEAYSEVRISQNRLNLDYNTLQSYQNKVNENVLWGLPVRTVRLSNIQWTRKIYGICTYYYTRTLTFTINYNTWDRADIINECTKMIRGKWDGNTYTPDGTANSDNPSDYIKAVDKKGNPTSYVLALNGDLLTNDTIVYIDSPLGSGNPIQFYDEANFLDLDIPTVL